MSAPSATAQPQHHPNNPTPIVDMDAVFSRPAYLTSFDDFLHEKNDYRALEYWVTEFTDHDQIENSRDIVNAINRTIAEIDELINEQLNQIIHHPKMQKLEASWRGLWYLVNHADGAKNIKIKQLDINWTEVTKDISRAIEFDQSHLFRKIYSEEYGTPGGEPYCVLIGDYEVSHRVSKRHPHNDVDTLDGLAQIAAASFAPFIAGASCELFGLDNFSTLAQPLKLHDIFSQTEYTKWNSIRNRIDMRFIGLTLPRILMRPPYRTTPGSYKGLYFHELQHGQSDDGYLWGNACYAFAAVLIREFKNVGWFGHIRGVPRDHVSGGLLTTLPTDYFATDTDGLIHKPVTDVILTDTIERELSDLGLIPLCQCHDTPFAAFYNNQSLQRPQRQKTQEGDVNAKLSAMLQHVLCGSRIAHYIKVIIRDKTGSFVTAEACEDYLRQWLFKYTTGREDLEWEEQARYPLREAAVQVRERPDNPGVYSCVIRLRPHYQLDQMVSELELVTELATVG